MAMIGSVISILLTVVFNPEVEFWSERFESKDKEISVIAEPKVIFIGGSSCTFSVDPDTVDDIIGRPSYNFGGSAYMGAPYMFERVKPHIGKGDIVVVGYEPEILRNFGRFNYSPLGPRMAVRDMDLEIATELGLGVDTLPEWFKILRPGLRNTVVIAGRLVKGGKAYTYGSEDLKSKGRIELQKIEYRIGPQRELEFNDLEDGVVRFLGEVMKFCESKGAHCIYTIPWQGTDVNFVGENREIRKRFLSEISRIMPVIPDSSVGVISGDKGFSDTAYHMGAELSIARSTFLGKELAKLIEEEGL